MQLIRALNDDVANLAYFQMLNSKIIYYGFSLQYGRAREQ